MAANEIILQMTTHQMPATAEALTVQPGAIAVTMQNVDLASSAPNAQPQTPVTVQMNNVDLVGSVQILTVA